jgi:hypothetical protein
MMNRSEFFKLQIASFISQSGSHFLTISLAAFVLLSSGSIVQSALVFVLSYLPSAFVSSRLGHWIDKNVSRKLLAANEILSIAASVLCGLAIYLKAPLFALSIVIAARSILLFTARTVASKWIKVISPPELQALRIKFFFLSFFLSTAVAGILAGSVLERATMLTVVAIDVATYFVSLMLILSLKDLQHAQVTGSTSEAQAVRLRETIGEILSNPTIQNHFLAVCLSQAIFQGAYSALVSFLPIVIFKLGASGIGYFQLAASLGITGGFLVVWLLPNLFAENRGQFPLRFVLLLSAGFIALFSCVSVTGSSSSLLSFTLFNLSYECIWLFNNSEFFRKSPPESIGRYQFTLASFASLVMAIFTLGYSFLLDSMLPQLAVASVLSVGALGWFLAARFSRTEKQKTDESFLRGAPL